METESVAKMMNLVAPVRLERTTLSVEGRCSIQLSYGTDYWIENKVAKPGCVVKVFSKSFAVKKSIKKLRIELRTKLPEAKSKKSEN